MEIYAVIERYSDWEGTWDFPRGHYIDKAKAEYECELLVEHGAEVGGDSSYWVSTIQVDESKL